MSISDRVETLRARAKELLSFEDSAQSGESLAGDVKNELVRPGQVLVQDVLEGAAGDDRSLETRVLSLGLLLQALLCEDLFVRYEKKTRPGFILSIILMVTLPAALIILGVGGDNAPMWLFILLAGMMYVGFIRLPAWRRAVPVIEHHLENLRQASGALEGGAQDKEATGQALASLEALRILFGKANYPMEQIEGLDALLARLG